MKARLKKLARSILRILVLLVAILFGFYLWNPQRVHFDTTPAEPSAKMNPDVSSLFSREARITIVVGHPDDAEFYISGSLLKFPGKKTLIVVTDGDKGYYPPFTTDVEANRKVRRQEQLSASKQYGAEVVFLGGPDGRYDPDEPKLRKALQGAIDATQPDYLITFDSKFLPKVQHRDHENAGAATLSLASDTSAKWILLFSTTAPNFVIDTTGTWETREKLLAIHASQFYGEKLERIKLMVLDRAMTSGEKINAETAEEFRAIQLKPEFQNPKLKPLPLKNASKASSGSESK